MITKLRIGIRHEITGEFGQTSEQLNMVQRSDSEKVDGWSHHLERKMARQLGV